MGKILVTGGAGYVGCVLVPKLLEAGHSVVVYDTLYYGDEGLPSHPSLRVVPGDIRDVDAFAEAVRFCGAVIHLAGISSVTSPEIDPALSKSVNFDGFEAMVDLSRDAGVRRFILASTSSVYGVSEASEVTERDPLSPINDDDQYKAMCEPILLERQSDDFTTVIIRSAAIYGPSPRMRFDLAINALINQGVNQGIIKMSGGDRQLPSIHIDDITDLYIQLLRMSSRLIAGETFNAGQQNHSLGELATLVRDAIEDEFPENPQIEIETTESSDQESCRLSSRKIAETLGWIPQRTVEDAVRELCDAFKNGRYPDSLTDDRYFNAKSLKPNVPV